MRADLRAGTLAFDDPEAHGIPVSGFSSYFEVGVVCSHGVSTAVRLNSIRCILEAFTLLM